MARIESVTLSVRDRPSAGEGWHDTVASNKAIYSFKYKGGHNDSGGMKTNLGEGEATLNLTLDTDEDRYALAKVTFRGDEVKKQLSWTKETDSTGAIHFANRVLETAYYTTIVSDTHVKGVTVPCDPMISNEPRI